MVCAARPTMMPATPAAPSSETPTSRIAGMLNSTNPIATVQTMTEASR